MREVGKACPMAYHFLLEVKKIVTSGSLPERGGWADQPPGIEQTYEWCLARGYIDAMRSVL